MMKSSAVSPVTLCANAMLNTGEVALLGEVGPVKDVTDGPKL
jgi:hypothetical protein